MKYLLIGILFLTSSYSMAVETCDYVDESFESEEDVFSMEDFTDPNRPLEDYEVWNINFNQHLLNQDDINLAVIGLANLNLLYPSRVDKLTGNEILTAENGNKILNQLVESDNTSFESLMRARSICRSEGLNDKCPLDLIQAKLEKLRPDNITVYLQPLGNAVADQDTEMMIAILDRMARTTYGQTLFSIQDSFGAVSKAYLNDFPMPNQSAYLNFLEDEGVDLDEFDRGLLGFQSMMLVEKMSSHIYGASFRQLFEACELIEFSNASCTKIAAIMIDKSDSFIMTIIGYGLLEKLHEFNGNAMKLKKAKLEKQAFSDYMMCIGKAQDIGGGLDLYLDIKVQDMFINGTHEGEYLEKMALYLYDKHKKLGTKNITDPRTCGLRYVKE